MTSGHPMGIQLMELQDGNPTSGEMEVGPRARGQCATGMTYTKSEVSWCPLGGVWQKQADDRK